MSLPTSLLRRKLSSHCQLKDMAELEAWGVYSFIRFDHCLIVFLVSQLLPTLMESREKMHQTIWSKLMSITLQ